MPEFQAGKLTFGGDAKKLAFALNAVGSKDTVKPVLALIDGGKVPKENAHGLYVLLAQIGGPAELGRVTERAAAEQDLLKGQRAELARAVEEAVRLRKVARPPELGKFRLLLLSPEKEARPHGARLIGLWKIEELRKNLEALAALPAEATPTEAAAALEGLSLFGDAKAKDFIMKLCGDGRPEVARAAIIAFASLDLTGAANFAARYFEHAAPFPEVADVFAAFLGRKGGPAALAKALAKSRFDHPDVAKLGLQAVRASTQNVPELTDALTKAGDLAAARKPPTPEEVKDLVADAAKGDPARGELVYRRKDLQCLACHAVGGAGGLVGPDVTSLGASAQPYYIV